MEKPPKQEGDDEEEAPPEEDPEADGGAPKQPEWKKEDYNWTVSNRNPKNLPQLYMGCKGINTLHEVK